MTTSTITLSLTDRLADSKTNKLRRVLIFAENRSQAYRIMDYLRRTYDEHEKQERYSGRHARYRNEIAPEEPVIRARVDTAFVLTLLEQETVSICEDRATYRAEIVSVEQFLAHSHSRRRERFGIGSQWGPRDKEWHQFLPKTRQYTPVNKIDASHRR